jgi:opacity protein-like surface antigen
MPLLVTGGLGLTHFSPEDTLLSDETRFSMNIGLATKIAVSENISLRVGGRVYATFFNSDSQVFCNEEKCAISTSSDLWVQSEVNAGITFSF